MSYDNGAFSDPDWSPLALAFRRARVHFRRSEASSDRQRSGTAPPRTTRAIALLSGDAGALSAWGLPTSQRTMTATGLRA